MALLNTAILTPTKVDRVRPANIFHQNECNIKKLEAFFVAHVLEPQEFVPPSRVAHRTRNESHLLQALVVIYLHVLARHVLLRLSRFLPYHCYPLCLRGSNEKIKSKCKELA